MCRIFGFRSVIKSQVHHSLVNADNAIAQQSHEHPDGWGVAYYIEKSPHLIRSTNTAINDSLFKKVSGLVSSQTVVAHLRKATHGENTILNTHPFQYGPWIFAHNGNIKNFTEHKTKLLGLVSPELKKFIFGDTDSELLFYIILSHLKSKKVLDGKVSLPVLTKACILAVEQITDIVGPYNKNDDAPPTETFLTFLISNGSHLLAHQGGKKLYYSTYKKRCSERNTCSSFNDSCEAPAQGQVNHLILSSEPLSGENIWEKVSPGQIVAVDEKMILHLMNF